MSDNKKYIVLFHGVQEFAVYDIEKSLDEVIEDIKLDRRYSNYDRNGATIIQGSAIYQISKSGAETKSMIDWSEEMLTSTK